MLRRVSSSGRGWYEKHSDADAWLNWLFEPRTATEYGVKNSGFFFFRQYFS